MHLPVWRERPVTRNSCLKMYKMTIMAHATYFWNPTLRHCLWRKHRWRSTFSAKFCDVHIRQLMLNGWPIHAEGSVWWAVTCTVIILNKRSISRLILSFSVSRCLSQYDTYAGWLFYSSTFTMFTITSSWLKTALQWTERWGSKVNSLSSFFSFSLSSLPPPAVHYTT